MHTMDNMWATLVMMLFTMLLVAIAAWFYIRWYEKRQRLFWFSIFVVGVVWLLGLYHIANWCVAIGWIVPCGDMCNVTMR